MLLCVESAREETATVESQNSASLWVPLGQVPLNFSAHDFRMIDDGKWPTNLSK